MPMAGTQQLVDLVHGAVQGNDVETTVNSIKSSLCRLIRSGEVELPNVFFQATQGHYARRLVHRDPKLGYSIVAMTWGPGQCTPVHDHAGMWCVEGVWGGSLDVQQYELMEQVDERFRFEKRNSYEAGVGSAGCLIPPYEYHRIANGCDQSTAVSLHIYGGDMNHCHVFEPLDDGWYVQVTRPLELDS